MEKLNLQGHKYTTAWTEGRLFDGSRPSQGVRKLLSITGFPESTDRTHWHKQ